MSGGLGESQVGFVYNENYQQFYNALAATDANPAAIAGLTANGGNSATSPVNGSTVIGVNSVNLRALGLSGAPLCNVTGTAGNLSCNSSVAGGPNAIDGIVGINTSITDPPQANNGSNYDMTAVVEHEIDEVLGLGSGIPDCNSCGSSASAPFARPEDLFRYNANGTRSSLTVNCASPGTAFFSYSGVTDLAQFNNACNGADFGDWQSSPLPNGVAAQVQDAFATSSDDPAYGPNEEAAMSAIGYLIATPEPATGWLVSISLVLAAVVFRRKAFGRR